MRKVLIVGAGGIGSHLSYNIFELNKFGQFSNVDFTLADDDTVDKKNLGYQKFEFQDQTDSKSEVLAIRYNFNSIKARIESTALFKNYECIVSAVDNTVFRKLLFNYSDSHRDLYWIDLRSKGRTVAAYTKSQKTTVDFMMKTLPKEEVEEGSCQFEYELNAGILQLGNKISACIGAQYLLNWYRNDLNPPIFTYNF